MQPSLSLPGFESSRVSANRANAAHSTGPRTEAGKIQSSRNSLKHGLTSATAVLPSEDAASYQRHCRDFHDEYQPETPTETQLVQELADTAWRLNRIPRLEAELLARSSDYCRRDHMAFRIADTTRALATLGLHAQRLSRQFHKTLDQLRVVQADRRQREQRQPKPAAALRQPVEPVPSQSHPNENGFVFSAPEIEPSQLELANQASGVESHTHVAAG